MEDLKNTDISDTFSSIWMGEDELEKQEQKPNVAETEDKVEELSTKTEDKQEVGSNSKGDTDLKTEHELLKKRFDESRSWGHKKNSAYVNAKKKVGEFLTKLKEDSIIDEEEAKNCLSFFDNADEAEETAVEQKTNPYVALKKNLDNEFSIFKKYSKIDDAEEKYKAFFSFLPLFSEDEQEKALNYMTNEAPEVIIDNIMLLGGDIHDNLYKGAQKSGGIIPFVKSLHSKIEKLEKRNKELETELDTTEGVVHNRSMNSKVSSLAPSRTKQTAAEIWQGQR